MRVYAEARSSKIVLVLLRIGTSYHRSENYCEEEHIQEKGNSKNSYKVQPQLQKWWSNRNDYNKGKKMFRPVLNKNL